MLNKLFDMNVFIYIILGLGVYGLFMKFIANILYRRLIKNSESMGASNSKLSKKMKLKFENYYKLNIGVSNVDIFVDKYVYKYRICGLLLSTWERIGGQVMAWCLLTGIVTALAGLIYEIEYIHILLTLASCVVTLLVLFMAELYANFNLKNKIFSTNLKDYMENQYKVKLEQEYFRRERLEVFRNEQYTKSKQAEGLIAAVSNEGKTKTGTDDNQDMRYLMKTLNKDLYESKDNSKKEDERIIEDILEEYLA